jgi:signal transduction histidine kinase
VQLILADQQRFSRAQRVAASLDLSDLVEKTIGLLSEDCRRGVSVEPDASLKQVGKVKAAPIALQQVLSNLFINSAESIHNSPNQNSGQISIHAFEEQAEGVPMVHLVVRDNGCGIPADKLPRIFERGFSTKSRGSGLGLHWGANTISALKGRIYAESEGEGCGAVFHVLLPLAQEETKMKEDAV